MGIKVGDIDPTRLHHGSTLINRAYYGGTLIYGELPGSARHTIYGETSPGTVVVGDDGVTIRLAASFYRYGATDGYRVVGGRLYIPPGSLGSLPSTVTMFWFHDTFNAAAQLSIRTYEESKIVTISEGWNDVYWAMPYAVNSYETERVWIGYTFGNAKYLLTSGEPPYEIEALDGSSIKFANPDDNPARSAFYGAGWGDGQSNNPYGIDIIFDEGA